MFKQSLILSIQVFFAISVFAQQAKDSIVVTDNFSIKVGEASLVGSLSVPKNRTKPPIVLIIAGSGPTDRNGNSIAGVYSNSYKILADSLLQNGVATLRYDKRGVAKSLKVMKNEASLTFDDYVNDANLLIDSLAKTNLFSKIIVAGHSEGALIGAIVAKHKAVRKYISIAGPGYDIATTIKKQLADQPDSVKQKVKLYFGMLSEGILISDVPKDYYSLFRPSVQPYMISWMKYNPTTELKNLKKPTLIIQGTHDIQVAVDDAKQLQKANPKAKLLLINGMSHLLKQAPAEKVANAATYTKNKDQAIDSLLVKEIVAFVKK